MEELYKYPKNTQKSNTRVQSPDIAAKSKSLVNKNFKEYISASNELLQTAKAGPSSEHLDFSKFSCNRRSGNPPGSKEFHVKPENIHTPCLGTYEEVLKMQDKPVERDMDDVIRDQIASGESLFKSYQFDPLIDEEETEKCIAFWKSVVKRNLAPLKCTIIDHVKTKSDAKPNAETTKNGEENKAKKEKDDAKEKRQKEILMEIWNDTMRELQKRRIHEMKLIGKARCKMCESVSSSIPSVQTDPATMKKEIKQLSSWKSKSKNPKKFLKHVDDESDTSNSNVGSSIAGKASKGKRPAKKISPTQQKSPEPPSEPPNQREKIQVSSLVIKKIKEDSDKIAYVDAIAKKDASGAYTEWRENMLSKQCPCNNPDCDCNKNPAIVSTKVVKDGEEVGEIESKIASDGFTILKKCSGEALRAFTAESGSSCEPQILSVEKTPDGRYVLNTIEPVVPEAKRKDSGELVELSNPAMHEIDAKSSPPPLIQTPEGSGELIELSHNEPASEPPSENQSQSNWFKSEIPENFPEEVIEVTSLLPQESSKKETLEETPPYGPGKISLSGLMDTDAPRHSILLTELDKINRRKGPRTVSVIMQCTCSEEDCDCENLCEVIQKDVIKHLEIAPPPPPPPTRISVQRRDSLEKYEKVIPRKSSSAFVGMEKAGLSNENLKQGGSFRSFEDSRKSSYSN